MYVTLEPCSMCFAAILNSRLKKLIWFSLAKIWCFKFRLLPCQITETLVMNTEVYGGFWLEIAEIMRDF